MKAYLLPYNPKTWQWKNIDSEILTVSKNEHFSIQWDCFSYEPKEGDIFFIVALGKSKRKGIFCSGIINELDLKKPSLINKEKITNILNMDINFLLNPEKNNIIDIDFLKREFSEQEWYPRNCISIKDKYIDKLLHNWNKIINESNLYLEKNKNNIILEKEYWEGNKQQKLLTIYERNIDARNDCIKAKGYACSVCGQKMEDIYGEIGKNFIHVHHINFLSKTKGTHKVDPIKDLIPVCPNCHSMLHIKYNGNYAKIDELKEYIRSKQH